MSSFQNLMNSHYKWGLVDQTLLAPIHFTPIYICQPLPFPESLTQTKASPSNFSIFFFSLSRTRSLKMANTGPIIVSVILVLVMVISMPCSATVYTVGDSSGWTLGVDYSTWTSDKTFNVGDSLGEYSLSSIVNIILSRIYIYNITDPLKYAF